MIVTDSVLGDVIGKTWTDLKSGVIFQHIELTWKTIWMLQQQLKTVARFEGLRVYNKTEKGWPVWDTHHWLGRASWRYSQILQSMNYNLDPLRSLFSQHRIMNWCLRWRDVASFDNTSFTYVVIRAIFRSIKCTWKNCLKQERCDSLQDAMHIMRIFFLFKFSLCNWKEKKKY